MGEAGGKETMAAAWALADQGWRIINAFVFIDHYSWIDVGGEKHILLLLAVIDYGAGVLTGWQAR